MKKIPLTKGKFAMVDDADYEELIKYTWCTRKDGKTFYAQRKENNETIQMHRVILGLQKGDKRHGEHIDHDGLNNQKINLRICLQLDNLHNRRGWGRSKYVGVSFKLINNRQYWVSKIVKNKKTKYLGYFPFTDEGEIQAAKVRDVAAREMHGQFACLNFPNQTI